MTTTTKKKKSAKPLDLRAAILETALHLFSTHGYFNTSVHDIRRAAGVSIGSIYNYFASKEAVAEALYNDMLAGMTAALGEIRENCDSTRDRCRSVMTYLFEMTETAPEKMAYMLYARHREFMPSAVPICSSQPFSMMREMVREGIESGEIRPMDTTIAATCLYGGMFRMIQMRLDGVIIDPLPTHLDTVWECGWRAVAA